MCKQFGQGQAVLATDETRNKPGAIFGRNQIWAASETIGVAKLRNDETMDRKLGDRKIKFIFLSLIFLSFLFRNSPRSGSTASTSFAARRNRWIVL
jgi:hypothetical protein